VRLAALALLLVVVAGCGGGGGKPLSRQEFAAKADAVCTKYRQQTAALTRPASMADLAKVADQTLSILNHATGDLHKLKPPASEQATADQWLQAIETLKTDVKDIRDKAKANDRVGVLAVAPRATRDNRRSNMLATQLGMTKCNQD
jgi:hypothetical protein